MRNLKLTLSYDGTDFAGWQTQKNQRTVQETLEGAIRAITREAKVHANASGRTDAGVHAVGQVVNFKTESKLPPHTLLRAINAHLPDDAVIHRAEEAAPEFCARRHAVRKLYRYVMQDGRTPDLFLRRYSWHVPYGRLDDGAMRAAAACLVGTHDFHSFETEWPNRSSSVRTITHLAVNRAGDFVWIDAEANGFLYNMVRSIAGTLANVGRGHWPASQVETILNSENRTQAGPTSPPQGLFLMRVTY